jgi:mannosyl-oligosaccharide alpha-1,2-mannosidase
MYRITGDERYQDQGWRMFTDWVDQTRTEWGFGSVKDVSRRNPLLGDNMESFVVSRQLAVTQLTVCRN